MFESVCKKFSIGMGFVALAILFVAIALRAHTNISDEDTWYHLKTGEYIVQHGIPTTDIFAFSLETQK